MTGEDNGVTRVYRVVVIFRVTTQKRTCCLFLLMLLHLSRCVLCVLISGCKRVLRGRQRDADDLLCSSKGQGPGGWGLRHNKDLTKMAVQRGVCRRCCRQSCPPSCGEACGQLSVCPSVPLSVITMVLLCVESESGLHTRF